MGFSTVLIISLAAGVVLIVGGGLMMYMANLVKSAYEIKVQINADVEERLTKMGDDLDKKSRWIKRDLLEEVEKIKVAIQTDNARKLEELTASLVHKVEGLEGQLRNERAEWVKAVDADRAAIAGLDTRVKALTRNAKKTDDQPKPQETPMGDEHDTMDDAGKADAKPSTPTQTPATPPARATGPTPVGVFLQELGNGHR